MYQGPEFNTQNCTNKNSAIHSLDIELNDKKIIKTLELEFLGSQLTSWFSSSMTLMLGKRPLSEGLENSEI